MAARQQPQVEPRMERKCSLEEIRVVPMRSSTSSEEGDRYDINGTRRYSFTSHRSSVASHRSSITSQPRSSFSGSRNSFSSVRSSFSSNGTSQDHKKSMLSVELGDSSMLPVQSFDYDEPGWWSSIVNSRTVCGVRNFVKKYSRREKALCCLHKQHPLRRNVRRLVKSKWFNGTVGLVVLLHLCVLAFVYQPYTNDDFNRAWNLPVVYVTVPFIVAYIAEAIIRIIGAGLLLHTKAYLRKPYHLLDVVVILVGLLYIIMMQGVVPEALATLMSLRLLLVLSKFESVNFILKVLYQSMLPLFYLGRLFLCVMVFFALIGIELFREGLHYGCFVNYTNSAGGLECYRVSDYPCSRHPELPGTHVCDQFTRSYCTNWPQGPNAGLTGFDNIIIALLTVFQCMTLEGWTSVLYLYESAYGYTYVWIYFLLLIFFGSVFILNMLLGVMTSVFVGVSERRLAQGSSRKLRERQRIEDDLKGYHKWIKQALSEDEHGNEIKTRKTSTEEDVMEEEEDEEELYNTYFDAYPKLRCLLLGVRYTRHFARVVVKSHANFFVTIVVILLNLIILATANHEASKEHLQAIDVINYIFTAFYIVECVLKIYGLGIRIYFKSFFNIFESICTLINLLDLLVLIHIPDIKIRVSAIVNTCRGFHLVLIFKYTRYWSGMKEMIGTLKDSISAILSLLALMFALLVFFSLFGMRLFGRRLSAQNFYHPNFNDFYSSLLLVFQLFTTEDWNTLMYRTASSYKTEICKINLTGAIQDNNIDYRAQFVALYYLIVVISVGFIFVNVFLAIAVDKLSEINAVKEDMTLRTEQQEEKRKERKEQLDALKNPTRPQKLRQTLQRVFLFTSSVRANSDAQQRKKTPRRVRSLINVPMDKPYVRKTGSLGSSGPLPVMNLKRLHNERRSEGDILQLRVTPVRKRSSSLLPHLSSDNSNDGRGAARPAQLAIVNPLTEYNLDSPLETDNDVEQFQRRKLSSVVSYQSSDIHSPIASSEGTEQSTASAVNSDSNEEHQQENGIGLRALEEESKVTEDRSRGRSGSLDLACCQQSSIQSVPNGISTPEQSRSHPFERTQSLPQIDANKLRRPFLTRQKSIEISPDIATEPNLNHQKSNVPPSLLADGWRPAEMEEEATIDRLVRQSSLEVISPLSQDTNQTTEHKKNKTWDTFKSKGRRVWAWLKEYLGTMQFNPQEELLKIPEHSAFFILSPDNRMRLICYKIVKATIYQILSYGLIFLSSGSLAFEIALPGSDKRNPICQVQELILYLDTVLVAWFLLEMLMKMVALGVFLHQGSYFRGLFNIVDFVVAVTSAIPLIYFYIQNRSTADTCRSYSYVIGGISLLRIVRVLRPIRFFRVKGIYLLIQGLLATLKNMGYIVFIFFITLMIFAIIGVLLFKGRFQYCSDLVTINREDCHGNYFQYPNGDLECTIVQQREWLFRKLNFDNIFVALLTLCTMITKEGWHEIMYNAIDSTGEGTGIKRNNNVLLYSVYFLSYMVVVTFILLNLFVGFVIVTFQRVGVKPFKEANLDRNQRNCVYFALTARPKQTYKPRFEFHTKVYKLVTSQTTNMIIFVALVLNTILLALQVYAIPLDTMTWNHAIYWCNVGFTVFFALEAVVKIVVLTPPNYFRHGWNVFAFLVALGSVLETVIQRTTNSEDQLSSVLLYANYTHIASSFRVLRLLQPTKKIRLILWTVLQSLEIFPWVGVLLVWLIYLFSITGIHLFGTIKIGSVDNITATTAITTYNNFANFPQAALVMIRCLTGENWEQVMLSCLGSAPCDPSLNNITSNGSCGNDVSYVFFPVFFLVGVILILNLFVAIIIDNFDYYVRDKSILGSHHLADFPPLWAKFDPTATGKIAHYDLMKLMRSLNPPLGWGKLCHQGLVYWKMMQLNIPLNDDGTIDFNSTLLGIVCQALCIETQGDIASLKQRLTALFPDKGLDKILPTDTDTTKPHYAALLIQYHWRRWKVKNEETISKPQLRRRKLSMMALYCTPDIGPQLLQRRFTATIIPTAPTLSSPTTPQPSSEEELSVELGRRLSTNRKSVPLLTTLGTIVESKCEDVIEEVEEEEEKQIYTGKSELDKGQLLLNLKRSSMFSEAETFVSAPSSPQGSTLSLYYSDTEEERNVIETTV